MKKEWSTGKIVGVVIGGIGAAVILFVSLVLSVLFLNTAITVLNKREPESDYRETAQRERNDKKERAFSEKSFSEDDFSKDDLPEENLPEEDSNTESEYYEFENALREDLNYKIVFEKSEKTEFENSKGDIEVSFSYPVVSGDDVMNLEGINAAIQKEIAYVEESLDENLGYLGEGDSYYFEGNCYVTYMSEETLSLAYVEYAYHNGAYAESYVVSVNIDMRSGMILDNTELLDIDDGFSVDFRRRSEKQNGETEALSYFSDQDITDCLTDKDCLIIFYTPLGMEVGMNFYGGWVTVTYPDYEKYQKQF